MPTLEQSRQRAKDERLQAHKISDTQYRVYNPTSKSQYDVFKSTGGAWSCTCPFAVKGSRVAGGDCKHLVRVLDREMGCKDCHAKDVSLRNRTCDQCRFHNRMEV